MSEDAQRDDLGAKLGMWLFLFTELLLFGGLFLLYAVYLARYPAEFQSGGHELNRVFGTLNTGLLLTSSLFAALAVTALQQSKQRATLVFLAATIACAAIFLANKYFEWRVKFQHDLYPASGRLLTGPPGEHVFFSLYFLTTGLHALHVLIGGLLLAWVAAGVRRGRFAAHNPVAVENAALYWHLVDLIWIFVFPLYYLIL